MKKKIRVMVAISGGVDSSVAAYLMKKKGFEVIGAFMKNWSETKNNLGECKWKEDLEEAIKITKILDIPLIVFDFEKEYRKKVVEKMFDSYKKGTTPNPDIECNEKVKFPLLIKEAKKIRASFVVTGHHARIKKTKRGFVLLRAKDEKKDQTYFLYRLSQKDLAFSLFPIGNYTKKEVREIAKKLGFPNYNRKSTTGICFIGKINMKNFLMKEIKTKKGKILDPEGNIIGYHDGIYYYTIGQRVGSRINLEINRNEEGKKNFSRWYVAKKNKKKNELIVAPKGHPLLYRKEIYIKNPKWILEEPKKNKIIKTLSRIRQVGELLETNLFYDKKRKLFKAVLNEAITGVSDGQAIVLYKGKKVLGGGIIGS